VVEFLQH